MDLDSTLRQAERGLFGLSVGCLPSAQVETELAVSTYDITTAIYHCR